MTRLCRSVQLLATKPRPRTDLSCPFRSANARQSLLFFDRKTEFHFAEFFVPPFSFSSLDLGSFSRRNFSCRLSRNIDLRTRIRSAVERLLSSYMSLVEAFPWERRSSNGSQWPRRSMSSAWAAPGFFAKADRAVPLSCKTPFSYSRWEIQLEMALNVPPQPSYTLNARWPSRWYAKYFLTKLKSLIFKSGVSDTVVKLCFSKLLYPRSRCRFKLANWSQWTDSWRENTPYFVLQAIDQSWFTRLRHI